MYTLVAFKRDLYLAKKFTSICVRLCMVLLQSLRRYSSDLCTQIKCIKTHVALLLYVDHNTPQTHGANSDAATCSVYCVVIWKCIALVINWVIFYLREVCQSVCSWNIVTLAHRFNTLLDVFVVWFLNSSINHFAFVGFSDSKILIDNSVYVRDNRLNDGNYVKSSALWVDILCLLLYIGWWCDGCFIYYYT